MPRGRRSRRAGYRRPRWWALAVAVLLSITAITLSDRGSFRSPINGVKQLADDAFSPVQRSVADLLRPLGGFLGGGLHGGALERQNEQLREQLAQARAQAASNQALRNQVQQLQRLAAVPGTTDIPTVVAQVQGDNVSDFADTVTIDKGTADGVNVDMPVVAAGGLVGLVVAPVSTHSATVQLVVDVRSAVDVRLPNADLALVTGKGQGNPLEVDDVLPGTPLSRGAVLTTGGLQHGRYPIGIPVARVTSFTANASATAESVTASPIVDCARLEYVGVLQWPPPGS